jgi:hypothetical protein
MKIMERVQYVKKVITDDFAANGTLGSDMQKLGVQALLKGRASGDWATFMCIFADNETQLARLTGDTSKDPQANEDWVKETSAYMVAGSPCGGMSPLHFDYLMDEDIDNGLPAEPDGKIVRPIDIPEPPATEGVTKDNGGGGGDPA